MKVKISGIGCSLVDFLYDGISFDSPVFDTYRSRKPGDGGLEPGKLVFSEDFARFAGKDFLIALAEITGGREPDARNLGGPSIVALVNVAQLTPREDIDISFYGALGEDETGDILLEFLEGSGIDLSGYEHREGSTPYTYVLSDPSHHEGHGERSFINNIGAGWTYLPDTVPGSFFETDIALYGGTALVPPIHSGLTELLAEGRAKGALNVVTTVYDFLNEREHPDRSWPLGSSDRSFTCIDLLIADREEALRISGREDLEEAARFFLDSGTAATVLTNGAKDVVVAAAGGPFGRMELTRLPVSRDVDDDLAADPARRGDTTGCGDNFAGGILTSVASQMSAGRMSAGKTLDLTEAVSWGVASGGFACFYMGGVYREQRPGEKREKIAEYKQLYDIQLSEADGT